MSNIQNIPWIEKYRPKNISDLASHNEIITTLKKFVSENNMPHLLFYGPPGTGKTSTILALANEIYEKDQRYSLVLELNASDDRGIATIRNKIIQFASTKSTVKCNKFKLIILDEADSMTKDAQSALRRVIEKYTQTVRFCLICNYLNKIIPAIQSRCTRYRYSPLDKELIISKISEISKKEKVEIDYKAIDALSTLCEGDMRRAINILQSCHLSYDKINSDSVYTSVGQPTPQEIEYIVSVLMNDTVQDCFIKITKIKQKRGFSLMDILYRISQYVLKFSFPPQIKMYMLSQLAIIEERLSRSTSEKIQLSSLIAMVSIVRYYIKVE